MYHGYSGSGSMGPPPSDMTAGAAPFPRRFIYSSFDTWYQARSEAIWTADAKARGFISSGTVPTSRCWLADRLSMRNFPRAASFGDEATGSSRRTARVGRGACT